MKILMPGLLITLALVACDRREVQPIEASDATTDTVVTEPEPAPAPISGEAISGEQVPPPSTSACAGLTGEAEADCLERESMEGESPPIEDPNEESTPP